MSIPAYPLRQFGIMYGPSARRSDSYRGFRSAGGHRPLLYNPDVCLICMCVCVCVCVCVCAHARVHTCIIFHVSVEGDSGKGGRDAFLTFEAMHGLSDGSAAHLSRGDSFPMKLATGSLRVSCQCAGIHYSEGAGRVHVCDGDAPSRSL
jgi:hypothetical protein